MFKYSIPCSDIVPRKWIEINFEIKSFNPINAFDDTQNKNIGWGKSSPLHRDVRCGDFIGLKIS